MLYVVPKLVAILAFVASTASPASLSAVDRVYADIMRSGLVPIGENWISIRESKLPSIFSADKPWNQDAYYSGFKLAESDSLLVFEFGKPVVASVERFCRARVTVYQFYSYDSERSYADLTTTTLSFKELVSFRHKDLTSDCATASLQDLEDYIFLDTRLTDFDVVRLWDRFRNLSKDRQSDCALSRGAELQEIGITPSGHSGSTNAFYFYVNDEGETIRVVLDSFQSSLKVVACEQGIVD